MSVLRDKHGPRHTLTDTASGRGHPLEKFSEGTGRGGLPCFPGNCPTHVAEKSRLHRRPFMYQLGPFRERGTGSGRSVVRRRALVLWAAQREDSGT